MTSLLAYITYEEYLERLEAVSQRLDGAGLKLKPGKCNCFQKEICYLGHVISEEGVATDPEKIAETVQEPQSFIGFTGSYRR